MEDRWGVYFSHTLREVPVKYLQNTFLEERLTDHHEVLTTAVYLYNLAISLR